MRHNFKIREFWQWGKNKFIKLFLANACMCCWRGTFKAVNDSALSHL